MHAIRQRLTYANVISSLCLFLLLGGGAAFAAIRLAPNSVGTGQLKAGAVTAGKIARRARQQLRGNRGPAGPAGAQGKIGKTGAKGAAGAAGAKGATGTEGTGPAFEVFGTAKAVNGPTQILSETLGAGSYVVSANAVVESSVPTTVTCSLNGGGEAKATVETAKPQTVSLSVARGLSGAGAATLTCAATSGTTISYANVVATQVKSQVRVAG